MPRRAELKSIASGVLGSFVSRNNDYEGYWALGLLYRDVLALDSRTVEYRLVGASGMPREGIHGALEQRYGAMLLDLLTRRGLPTTWLKTATLSVQFEHHERPVLLMLAAERPFLAVLSVETDLGKVFEVRHVGSCWPHDPRRESRSGRAVTEPSSARLGQS